MEKKKAVVTQTLPAIALRGLVLFPKMVLHFDIGREKSILALNSCLESGRKIFLTAQQDVADDAHDTRQPSVGQAHLGVLMVVAILNESAA